MKTKTKKNNNRYTRYTYFDELRASNTNPMPATKIHYHLITVYEAISAIHDNGLTPERWFPLLYATKMMETLVLNRINEVKKNATLFK